MSQRINIYTDRKRKEVLKALAMELGYVYAKEGSLTAMINAIADGELSLCRSESSTKIVNAKNIQK